ncbi:MAG: NUDIX domain-containing protein [Roseibium sp.]|uniref:NUDIX hydrolase n=1 Tax=Roseibium sp. TaxID=1936156 RepID=UPI00262ADD2F|nr:NUDIX domain-containing protein [Roseibium sp.]MCV0425201.1 NUDIX domain-containing protein [Roseibium sp.]
MPDVPIRVFLSSLVAVRKVGADYEVLLLKRTQSLAGEWCQVAGSIEDGETAWQAALRELEEETGLTPISLYSADTCEQFYEAARDAITMAPVFVAYIDPGHAVHLNHEHSEYRWVSFDDAVEMVAFGGQRRVLRWVEDEFVNREPSKHLLIDVKKTAVT